ncbi:hypothetical protein [Nocardioides mangrovicus]|uniref:hypothetical protein n=1 Tax=Nocardioides mangrovicus TaxID=2478913 RepID=UPI0018E0A6E3|nr:hypothetical protein [Nocardioides mangrovicus]
MSSPELTPEQRRRLAEVFGDDTDQTSDDTPEPGERAGRDDAWWRAQRPPHHGG